MQNETNIRSPALDFFTVSVEGEIYGGWYRLLRSGYIEILSVGLMRQTPLTADNSPEALAREVLDRFVRARMAAGAPVPSLGAIPGIAQNGRQPVVAPVAQKEG